MYNKIYFRLCGICINTAIKNATGTSSLSYRHRLFDSGDDGMHEGFEFIPIVQIVRVSHTHEEKMSGQTGDNMYTNTTRSQIWR